jgi:transposase-like protein
MGGLFMSGGAVHDERERRRAAELFEEGLGFRATADLVGVPREAVRQWLYRYRSVGVEGLMEMGTRRTTYPFEVKVAAARAVAEGGATRAEAMARFGVASSTALGNWVRAYREGGEEALRPRPKGRPRGSGGGPAGPTRERELERQVRRLEAEVAYLKKSIALKAERRSRTARRRSS